jgi:hypothetical protein
MTFHFKGHLISCDYGYYTVRVAGQNMACETLSEACEVIAKYSR